MEKTPGDKNISVMSSYLFSVLLRTTDLHILLVLKFFGALGKGFDISSSRKNSRVIYNK